MKKSRIAYYISTGLMTVLFGFGATMYFAQYSEVSAKFVELGYPTHIIYPLAIAKILGLLAIWTRKSALLKDLAYAGFFYDLILAAMAHQAIQDGGVLPPLLGLVLVVTSYTLQRNLTFGSESSKTEPSA